MAFSPMPQSNDITMRVEGGIRGWYRAGQWIPLMVSVDSANVTVDGHLQARIQSNSTTAAQFETTYKTPFTIAQGDSKRVFLYVSLDNFTRNVQVELVDRSGRVVVSADTALQQLDYDDLLYAVITDSVTGAPDVSRETVGRGNSQQVNWRLDDIPPSADALRSVDVLVFTDVDTSVMSTDQQTALRQWVASGGHLMVTGGNNWQRTTSGLMDLLPTIPQETVTLADVRPLAGFLYRDDADLHEETLAVDSEPLPNASVLADTRGVPLIVRGAYGGGTVDFLAVDGSAEPLRSWNDFPLLWHELALSAPSRASWTHGIERFDIGQDAVSNVTGFDLPSVLQLLGFLLVYIALIGPINYFALRFVGRRELAWVTIPSLIVVFTLFAYFTGFSVRGDAVSVNQISVVQVWDGVETARVDGLIGILSPRRTTYDVRIGNALNLRTLPNTGGLESLSEVTIAEGSDYIAEDIPVDAAIMTSFATSGAIPRPAFSGDAQWTLRGAGVNSRLDGQFTNGLAIPLEDAVVIAGDSYYDLGTIEAGDTAEFSFSVALQSPSRKTLGSRVDPNRPVQMSYYTANYDPSDRNLCSYTTGPRSIYKLVLGRKSIPCVGGTDDEGRRLRRRALLMSAINNEIDRNAGRENSVYIMGWSEDPILQIEINKTSQEDDGTVLYIYEIPTTLDLLNNRRVSLPAGMFTWTMIERDEAGRIEPNPDLSFFLSGGQAAAVRFTPMADVPLIQVEQIEVILEGFGTLEGEIVLQLWNWEDETWQEIPFSTPNQSRFIIEDQAFVGPQNAIQVLVAAESERTYQQINRLAVSLRGTG